MAATGSDGKRSRDYLVSEDSLTKAIDSIADGNDIKNQVEISQSYFLQNDLSPTNLEFLERLINAINESKSLSAFSEILKVINEKLKTMKDADANAFKEFIDKNQKILSEISDIVKSIPATKDGATAELFKLKNEFILWASNKDPSAALSTSLETATAAATSLTTSAANPTSPTMTPAATALSANPTKLNTMAQGLPWNKIKEKLKAEYGSLTQVTENSLVIGNTQINNEQPGDILTAQVKSNKPTEQDINDMCKRMADAVNCIDPPRPPVNLKGGSASQAVQIFEGLKSKGIECVLDKSLVTKIQNAAASSDPESGKYSAFLKANADELGLVEEKGKVEATRRSLK